MEGWQKGITAGMKFKLEPYNRDAPDTELLADLLAVARGLNKGYVTKDEYNKHGRWCAATFQKRFGSWCRAHDLAGLERVRNYDATAEDCLADIRRVAKKLGKGGVTTVEYRCSGRFSPELVTRRGGPWADVMARAGLAVSPLYHKRATNEQLFENLECLWERLGRQPKRPDFVKSLSRYSYDTYCRRFGSLRKALEAFVGSFDGDEPENHGQSKKKATDNPLPTAPPKRHKTSRAISWRTRFLVMRRDRFRCRICGDSPARKSSTVLVVDHIVPWDGGGETTMENLQTLCEPCNGGKSNLPMISDATEP